MKNIRSKKGFTLVEIMIVVVIIALLAAMAVPAFNRVRRNSRVSTVENLVRQISGAADQYFLQSGLTTVNYGALTGENSNPDALIKGDPAATLTARGVLLTPAITATTAIAQGATYNFAISGGGTVSGTW